MCVLEGGIVKEFRVVCLPSCPVMTSAPVGMILQSSVYRRAMPSGSWFLKCSMNLALTSSISRLRTARRERASVT